MSHKVYVEFPGRMVMVGFGSIGQGVLPLILRHIGIRPDRIVIVTADDAGRAEAEKLGVRFIKEPLVRENYRRVLENLLGRGDFLVNLSVDVSSIALIKFCWERGAMYIDTCIEPWAGGYTDPATPPGKRTNYALREDALALRTDLTAKNPTAILTHGANPGLVSHLVKEALLTLKRDIGVDKDKPEPATRQEWAELAQALNIKVIHVAERDTQVSPKVKEVNEFVNTWS
ncbi:MAG TPA: saccharopine dehydrogenase NADP-binding domain-containing protein, partial [Steroidobacteraceae bacterium]|nr:saccharopine dehydrogenase NADP-binding domain-containing protein [Steroidobacteraceae bacterium]